MGSAPLSVPRSRLEQRIVLIVRGRHNLPLAGPRPMTNPVQTENGGGSVWQAASISGLGSHWKMVMGKWFALVNCPFFPEILYSIFTCLKSLPSFPRIPRLLGHLPSKVSLGPLSPELPLCSSAAGRQPFSPLDNVYVG